MASKGSSAAELISEKTNNGIIVIGSVEKARQLGVFGSEDIYVSKEDHEDTSKRLLKKIEQMQENLDRLGKKYDHLLFNHEYFKAKMVDVLADISTREDDFIRRISTEFTLFKSEKTKSIEKIRKSSHKYEEQANKAMGRPKRPHTVDKTTVSGKKQRNT